MWLLPGWAPVWVSRRSEASSAFENIEMVLDTAATDQIRLSPYLMDAVIAEFESFGPRRIQAEGQYPRFENCTRDLKLNKEISRLRIQPGTQRSIRDPLGLDFPIINHLEFDYHRIGECTLEWKIGTTGAPNMVLIGTAYLSKMVTVFDKLHNRIGMCRRGYNPIQN